MGGKKEPDAKSDVYSFGVLLLEMLSGKEPRDVIHESGSSFIVWVRQRIEEDDVEGFLDPSARSCEEDDDMLRAAQLALRCTAEDPDARPSMLHVVDFLSQEVGAND